MTSPSCRLTAPTTTSAAVWSGPGVSFGVTRYQWPRSIAASTPPRVSAPSGSATSANTSNGAGLGREIAAISSPPHQHGEHPGDVPQIADRDERGHELDDGQHEEDDERLTEGGERVGVQPEL